METRKLLRSILATIAIAVLATTAGCEQPQQTTTTTAAAQEFEFEAGYPTAESSEALYDEMDYHRATQAYIWATPMLNSMGMMQSLADFDVTPGDRKLLVWEHSARPENILMTANNMTPYAFTVFDVSDEPMVLSVDSNDILGGFTGFHMRALEDVVFAAGTKYLITGPDYDGEIPEGYKVVESESNLVWFFGRANHVSYKGQPALDLFKENLNYYPLSQAGNPPAELEAVVPVGDEVSNADWPKDYKAWELIHAGIQLDNISTEDKMIFDFLRGLGIEHGKPFNPNARQKAILERAAETGHKMVRNLAFNNRSEKAPYWSGERKWENIVTHTNGKWMTDTHYEVTARNAWYELVMNAVYLTREGEPMYGKGSDYLAGYKDSTGAYLNGSNQYKLTVPADVPVANFWSVTVYHNETRSMIVNEQGRYARGSNDDVVVNADGTINLFFGATLPEGAPESNWVQTNADEGWFTLFRFFGPEKPFYDGTFMLNDFEKIN